MSQTAQFFLMLGVVIVTAKAMGFLSYRIKQPAVLGELLAGLVLGPSLLNLFAEGGILPNALEVQALLLQVAELGVLFLMFMAGLGVDLGALVKVGKPSLYAGFLSVVVPLAIVTPSVMAFGTTFEGALFVAILLAPMSTSISAQVMLELGVLRRKEGLTLLGAALVDDALVLLLVSLFLAINPNGIIASAEPHSVLEVVVRMVGFVVIGGAFMWFILPRMANFVSRLPIAEGCLMFGIVSALVFASAAEALGGIAGITGAFMAGVGIGRAKRGTIERVERGIHAVNYGFLVPIFFVSIGLKANLQLLDGNTLPFALTLVFVAIVSKFAGGALGSLGAGFSLISAVRVGTGMIGRGEVGLIVGSLGVRLGILQAEAFTVTVFVVILTTLLTPPLVRLTFQEPKTEAVTVTSSGNS
jgi:Kef-type K+ transport system membrane component KefB